jgi:hypothetical protein
MQDRVHPPNNTNYYLSELNYGSKLTFEFKLEKRFKNVPRKKKLDLIKDYRFIDSYSYNPFILSIYVMGKSVKAKKNLFKIEILLYCQNM